MTDKPTKPRQLPFNPKDLQGLTRLGVDAVVGVTGVVEHLHQSIASGAGLLGNTGNERSNERTSGLTGLVYRAVRGTTRAVGMGLDGLTGLLARLPANEDSPPQREAMLAALNGVWGDHLQQSANPLAISMRLRVNGRALDLDSAALAAQLESPTDRIAVLVHGLCMNDLQWTRQGHDHGTLARTLGYTPVYLHYNTGLHVSQNGRAFSALLAQLLARWPVPPRELVIIGHSMGGLVARSACHIAAQQQQPWLAHLKKLVFLGTPHHGAPMERGGRLIDSVLGVSPYLAPFARLGKARSAGITDLRFGNVQDTDWQAHGHGAQAHDDRQPTPLPEGVTTCLVAAVQSARIDDPRNALIGDGLVPLNSALGKHRRAGMALGVPETRQLVLLRANHWDLLNRDEVSERLRVWLQE